MKVEFSGIYLASGVTKRGSGWLRFAEVPSGAIVTVFLPSGVTVQDAPDPGARVRFAAEARPSGRGAIAVTGQFSILGGES